MYGNTRYLYDNKITTASMITPSSQMAGVITGAAKQGTGSATMSTSGSYAGAATLLYTIQIDDVSGGNEIGQATFRWRTSATTPGAWEAEGVATDTAMTALNYGVEVGWAAGSGNDFEGDEIWSFFAYASFGVEKLLDLDRGTGWRSNIGELSNVTLTVNFGAPVNVTTCALFDHNLTSGATVTLKGNTADAWGAPLYTEALTIIEYLDETYQYWQLEITDALNPDGYLKIGELFLGAHLELEVNPEWGATQDREWNIQQNSTPWGVRHANVNTRQERFNLSYPFLSETDFVALQAVFDAVYDTVTGRVRPFFLHLFSDDPAWLYLVHAEGKLPRTYRAYLWHQTTLEFTEVVNPYD